MSMKTASSVPNIYLWKKMDIYSAINQVMKKPPRSEVEAEIFLKSLEQKVQKQLINAIYLGRDHLHHTSMRADIDPTCAATDHIQPEEYALILWEKASGRAVVTYLGKLQECAAASQYDLRTM